MNHIHLNKINPKRGQTIKWNIIYIIAEAGVRNNIWSEKLIDAASAEAGADTKLEIQTFIASKLVATDAKSGSTSSEQRMEAEYAYAMLQRY